MSEKQKHPQEKEARGPLQPDIDSEKVIAGNIFQADALRRAVKSKRLYTLRSSTDDIQTQLSHNKRTVIRESKAGNSIDV